MESGADASDGRATLVALTTAGHDAARAVAQIEKDLYAVLGAVLDDAQLDAALTVLRDLVADLPTGIALQRRIEDKNSTR